MEISTLRPLFESNIDISDSNKGLVVEISLSNKPTHNCINNLICLDVLLTVHLSIFISVIYQLDAQNFCFTISLFHDSTCFEHMCSSSGGQNCIT